MRIGILLFELIGNRPQSLESPRFSWNTTFPTIHLGSQLAGRQHVAEDQGLTRSQVASWVSILACNKSDHEGSANAFSFLCFQLLSFFLKGVHLPMLKKYMLQRLCRNACPFFASLSIRLWASSPRSLWTICDLGELELARTLSSSERFGPDDLLRTR